MSDHYDNALNYSTGRYGLVDAFYRHIWLNLHHEQTAHQLKKIFWSKAPTLVFDLQCFVNWSETTVDSDVSLNWLIPADDLLSPRTQIRLTNSCYNHTQTEYVGNRLSNQPSSSALPLDRQKDLQKQMLLYKHLYQSTGHYWQREINTDFYDQIDWAFQTELDLENIQKKLYSIACDQLGKHTDLAGQVLRALGRLYG